MGRKGETTSYAPPSFEEFYTRKLEALKVQLKSVIYDGLPYTTSEQYACKVCHGRIKLHMDGRIFCLTCALPTTWRPAIRDRIEAIMQEYPNAEQCAQEWRRSRPQPKPQDRTPEAVAFGGTHRGGAASQGMDSGAACRKDRKASWRTSTQVRQSA